MNNICLSICIPTYNRGEIVFRTVKNVLRYEGQNIEVVVSNNCSEDNTEELIKSITDERIKYFKNSYNNGADNLITVLTYATGDYLLLLSDEDDVILDEIPHLLEILAKEEPAILIGSTKLNGVPYGVYQDRKYEAGMEALKGYGLGASYMSGYVYNRKILKKVMGNLYGENINRTYGFAYNFTNLARKMLVFGKYMTIKSFLTDQRESGKIDLGNYFDGGQLCYAPEKRLKSVIESVEAISTINISMKDKFSLILDYKKYLYTAHKEDWELTFENDLEKIFGGEQSIIEYYKKNREEIRGIKYYKRLITNLKQCDDYINTSIFHGKYLYVKIRYIRVYLNAVKSVVKKMVPFMKHKFLVESQFKETNK